MDFYNVINKRFSCHLYKEDTIPKEKINNIINAAMKSPSWKNNTSYKIIVIEDDLIKDKIAKAIENKDDKASNAIKMAPISIIVIGNPNLSGEVDGKEYYLVDAAIAMEHIILAATAENLGTCWIGAFDEKAIKDTLEIPNEFKVIGITPLGICSENIKHYEEKLLKDYVFLNKYKHTFSEK